MLEQIIDYIFYGLLNLDSGSKFIETLNFFVYDSIKILLLLFLMITIIGFLRSYLPRQKIKEILKRQRFGAGNFMASGFGAITPFCSCSSIPIFLSFLQAGVPLGITFSFLITSPIVNEYLVVLMLGFFGWKITLAYVITGVLIGTIGGIILGKLRLGKYIEKDIVNSNTKDEIFKNIKQRVIYGLKEGRDIVKKIWIWLLIGVGIGAVIHNYVPQEVIQGVVSKGGIFAVPIAIVLGVPMYGSCAAIVPVAIALFQKGIPLGTALAFMMAVAALSLPEAIILRRAMKLKLIAVFFGVVALAILITGYVYNILQGWLV